MEFRLFFAEIQSAFHNWTIYIPSLLSGVIALTVFSLVLNVAYGDDVAQNISTGWLMFASSMSSLAFATVAVIDVTMSRSMFYLHLPVRIGFIALTKICVGSLVACVLAALLSIIALLANIINISDMRYIVALIFLQSFAIGSLIVIPSIIFKDITKFSLVSAAIVSMIQYLSPVFVPYSSFPNYIRPVLLLNPLTPTISIMRSEGDFNSNLLHLLLLSVIYGFLGTITIRLHLSRHKNRLKNKP